jgi:hypothetical protein
VKPNFTLNTFLVLQSNVLTVIFVCKFTMTLNYNLVCAQVCLNRKQSVMELDPCHM